MIGICGNPQCLCRQPWPEEADLNGAYGKLDDQIDYLQQEELRTAIAEFPQPETFSLEAEVRGFAEKHGISLEEGDSEDQ